MTTSPIAPEILCQEALQRTLNYLGDDDVELNADTCRRALRLVESALAVAVTADLPARCVAAIPDYFERPVDSIPDASPPLTRGRIGYE